MMYIPAICVILMLHGIALYVSIGIADPTTITTILTADNMLYIPGINMVDVEMADTKSTGVVAPFKTVKSTLHDFYDVFNGSISIEPGGNKSVAFTMNKSILEGGLYGGVVFIVNAKTSPGEQPLLECYIDGMNVGGNYISRRGYYYYDAPGLALDKSPSLKILTLYNRGSIPITIERVDIWILNQRWFP